MGTAPRTGRLPGTRSRPAWAPIRAGPNRWPTGSSELQEQAGDGEESEPSGAASAPDEPVGRMAAEVEQPARTAAVTSPGPAVSTEPYGDRARATEAKAPVAVAAGGAGAARAAAWTRAPKGADRADTREPGREPRQGEELSVGEPVEVAGYLDLREEGYGFLRVNGYLPSRDDVYVSVKQTRQYGLRKGDRVTGLSRLAGRNEKNPALLQLVSVNGGDPEQMRQRPPFEDLTPLFPDEKLRLENPLDPGNMTARIIDLIARSGRVSAV